MDRTRRDFLASGYGVASTLTLLGGTSAVPATRERHQTQRGSGIHRSNGDDQRYPRRIASFTKALPHNSLGEVEAESYEALLAALTSGRAADFEIIRLGSVRKLANPQAALSTDPDGPMAEVSTAPPPPSFASEEQAAEMAELYWQALARDVPFSAYASNPLTARAANDLSTLPQFSGPRDGTRVTPATLFRCATPGDLRGPYISQFLYQDIQYGPITVPQQFRPPAAGLDYAVAYPRWLAIQNGEVRGLNAYETSPRYHLERSARFIRNGRDLGEYVHRDFTYQAFLNAGLILLGMFAPPNRGNPYRKSRTQTGFATFGEAELFDLLARVANCALKASWYQKWIVHRRLRPEEFGGRVHLTWRRVADYPVHASLFSSSALETTAARQNTCLLAQAYPDGCPTHPSYPSGHAVIAGACTTVLKAVFDESFVIANPVVPSADGRTLQPYRGDADLSVGGELNKLASNIAIGRNFAGIHWRSDAAAGLAQGEQVALQHLRTIARSWNEPGVRLAITGFNGARLIIEPGVTTD